MHLTERDRQRLRAARARKGWGLRRAAAEAGTSVGVWQRAEHGESIEYSSFVKILDALGIDPDDVVLPVDGPEPPEDPDPTDPGGASGEVAELRQDVESMAMELDEMKRLLVETNDLLKAALSGDASNLFADPDDPQLSHRPQPPPMTGDEGS